MQKGNISPPNLHQADWTILVICLTLDGSVLLNVYQCSEPVDATSFIHSFSISVESLITVSIISANYAVGEVGRDIWASAQPLFHLHHRQKQQIYFGKQTLCVPVFKWYQVGPPWFKLFLIKLLVWIVIMGMITQRWQQRLIMITK